MVSGRLNQQERYRIHACIQAGFSNSNPVGMFNRYKYAANNPYKYIDPDGRCEKTTGSRICGGGAGNNVSVIQVNPSSSGVGAQAAPSNANSNPGSSQQLNATTVSNTPTGAQGTNELVREWSLSQPSSNGGR